jgi:hypothetical protein
VNPYEMLWQNYSNSYARTTLALRSRGRAENSERQENACFLCVVMVSPIPEYRAYIYGSLQASCDDDEARALRSATVCPNARHQLKVQQELEDGLYAYLREKLVGWQRTRKR